MFDDGTTAGDDPSQSLADVRGRIQSEYDVYKNVLAKADAGETDAAIRLWLATRSDALPQPGRNVELGDSEFSGSYRFCSARLSERLLKLASEKSIPEMVAYVRSVLGNKAYPHTIVNQ